MPCCVWAYTCTLFLGCTRNYAVICRGITDTPTISPSVFGFCKHSYAFRFGVWLRCHVSCIVSISVSMLRGALSNCTITYRLGDRRRLAFGSIGARRARAARQWASVCWAFMCLCVCIAMQVYRRVGHGAKFALQRGGKDSVTHLRYDLCYTFNFRICVWGYYDQLRATPFSQRAYEFYATQ